jgi:cytochrome c peroxidase
VARTAPYMHDGSIKTLEEVIEYYNRGANPNPRLDTEIHGLHLTSEEKRSLVIFLNALTGNSLKLE